MTALALAGCGSGKPSALAPVKPGPFVACLRKAGADPVQLPAAKGHTRYFEPVNNVSPTAVYALKHDLYLGIFATQAQATGYSHGGTALSLHLAAQFEQRNIVLDVVTKTASKSSFLGDQNLIGSCLPS